MEAVTRRRAITRVGHIEGYVAALRRKIEKDEGVIEVLRKTHTLRRSIDRLEELLLEERPAASWTRPTPPRTARWAAVWVSRET